MALNRVSISSNASSPFRVSVAGVDVSVADFAGTIFDGNQRPLRLFSTGWFGVAAVLTGGIAVVNFAPGPATFGTPVGQYPLCIINGRQSFNPLVSSSSPLQTVFHAIGGTGFGAVLVNGQIWGLNFHHDLGTVQNGSAIINFCIFKNYG